MKIIILNKYQNKVSRGAETFVSELAHRLSKKHEVKVISDVNYLSLVKERFDVIIPTNGRLQVVLVRLISWLKGSKMIVSGQSGPGLDDRINLYSFPDVFVGLTQFQSNWAKRTNPFVKVETIPNGVSLDQFTPVKKRSDKVVLSVGAFTNEKRHDLTIKAVSRIEGARLIIVGSGGSEKDKITEIGNNMLGGNFRILSLSYDKMPSVYKKASVFAFPTVKWESFGIAMVEAMATGIPVVASDDPIRREIVGDGGKFVDPEDSDAYAKAIKESFKMDWGSKPRKQAEKYSWDNIAKAYEELLKRI